MPHSETGIEQQYSLAGPAHEVAVTGNREALQVIAQLLVHVSQAGGHLYTQPDTEAQTVCLSGAMVGILAQDDHFNLVDGTS